MTPIFFLVMYGVGILATLFKHPIFGLYTYLFTFYMAPNHTWWSNQVPDIRYLFIAAVLTMLSMLKLPRESDRRAWYQVGVFKLMLAFVVLNWLQIAWALSFSWQFESAIMYSKHFIMMVVIYRMVNTVDLVWKFALANIIGSAWFGYVALGAGGGRLERVGGAVSGANELSIHVAILLLVGGLLLLCAVGRIRLLIFGALPLIANCLILTVSRGAFLGLVAGGIWSYFFVPKSLRWRFRIAGLLGVLMFSMLAHDELIDRFMSTYLALTTDEVKLDGSASSRSVIALAGLRMGLDHPMGLGYKGTAILSPKYMPEWVLDQDTGRRAAHNSTAALFAEHGVLGTLFYYGMALWVIATMARLRSSSRARGWSDLEVLSAAFGSSMIIIYGSGNFSNNIDLETQYWCLAILAVVTEIGRQRLEARRVQDKTAPGNARIAPSPAGALPGASVGPGHAR